LRAIGVEVEEALAIVQQVLDRSSPTLTDPASRADRVPSAKKGSFVNPEACSFASPSYAAAACYMIRDGGLFCRSALRLPGMVIAVLARRVYCAREVLD
jgi:hypothetical protein